MSKIEQRALTILAGCPDGCTEMVLGMHGISKRTIAKLWAAGLLWRYDQYHVKLRCKVARYWISQDGRAAIN